MARHDGQLIAAQEVALDLGELARVLPGSADAERARRLAMARLLSATEGWKTAAAALDGAFADTPGRSGLTASEER